MATPTTQLDKSGTRERVLQIVRGLLVELGSQGALPMLSATSSLDRDLGLGSLERLELLSRLEGIIPALEPAHAIAKVMELAPARPKDHLMVINLSGRGDKDVPQVGDILKAKKK